MSLTARLARFIAGCGLVLAFLAGQPTSPSVASQGAGERGRAGNGLLAMVSDRSGNDEIYSMHSDGTIQVDLTNNPASDTEPAWSPDGTRLAFTSDRTGNRDVYVMGADGSGVMNLTNDPGDDHQATWSPDGTRIAFTSDRSGNDDIFRIPADGGEPVDLASGPTSDSDPAWSPDGSLIAFSSDRDGDREIFTMSSRDGSDVTRLTDDPAVDSEPGWSPTGSQLVFTTDRDGNDEIYVMRSDGSALVDLSNDPASDTRASFSPDGGTRVVFTSDRTGAERVYLLNVHPRTRHTYGLVTITHQPPESAWSWQPLPAGPPSGSPIQHVVVVFQENHSFDNVLGVLCVRDERCDGTTQGVLADGTVIDLPAAADTPAWALHEYKAQQIAINGGRMNGFSLLFPCDESHGYQCYEQYKPGQIPGLAALARAYVISDRTFESDTVASWGSHINLAASTLDGFYQADPLEGGHGPGWGCESTYLNLWSPTPIDPGVPMPNCVPKSDGTGPFRPSVVPWQPTIMDRLAGAGLSWKAYAPGSTEPQYGWSICPTFADCIYTSQASNLVERDTFTVDAASGNLPNLSFVIPDLATSQHDPRSMLRGDNHISAVVNAVMNGPQWNSTAVFITYDDCGCYYDHVAPPPELGVRVPMVIVSPYARAGFTDSNVASYNSLLAFTEHTFGLAPLSPDDASAYDYAASFDYGQTPIAPMLLSIHPLSRAQIEAEREALAKNPEPEDDPT